MAAVSTFSENLDSINRGRAEPKKKLKKRRSIRVSRMPSLKPRSKSRFDWPPSEFSSDASSLPQASSIALSDSAPNYMKSTSSFTAKKECQGGSECDDVHSEFSSSCGSSDRVELPFISISDDAAMLQHPSSIEVSDASPIYVEAKRWSGGKKGYFQASLCDSESSYDSYDPTKSSHASESNSVYFSRKSLHSPLRTSSSSIRNARVFVKKASFKPKRNSLKSSQISDSHVDKATCSSIIKDSRFPEHVELQAGEKGIDKISFMKVCPYHHCSLHGHSYDPPPKEHSSHGRRQSLKPQISKKPRSVTERKAKPASSKKEGIKKHQMNSNKEGRIQQGALVQRETVKAFYTEKGIVLETHLGSYNMKMDVDQSISPDIVAELEGGENTASSVAGCEKNLILHDENTDFPHPDISEMFKTLDNPVATSCESDATFNKEPSENVPSEMERNSTSRNIDEATMDEREISPVSDSHTSQDLRFCMEEPNRNLKPETALAAGFTPDGGSECKLQNSDSDSEPPLSSEVQNPHFNKGRHISMWHLIHKHMASGIATEDTKKPHQAANEDKKVEEAKAKTDPAKDSSDAYVELPYSDVGIENQETANQEIEVRKLFAIKLVREAIEKILLPEVQDQSSETQSITSDIVEDQEILEKNQQCPGEGCHGRNGNRNTSGNATADPIVPDHTEDSLSGQEEKGLQTKLGKKFDKKSPSNWSNLKRWILLQRFIKELEKVRKFNPSKPQHLQLETGAKSEKVNLRHQTVDERRRAEEWMLDYALRQVVSELAPTQKKKVSLLVKAFEIVVPTQEDRNIPVTLPKLKDESHKDAFITKKEDLSPTEMKDKKSHAEENNTGKPDGWERSSVLEGHGAAKGHDRPLDNDTQSSTDSCLKLDSIINSCGEVPGDAESEQEPKADLIGNSKPISISQHIVADTNAQNMEHIPHSTLDQQVQAAVNREFPPMDSRVPEKENESCQSQLDKKNYIRTWHMVYQHVASAIATKVGSQLLGGEDEEAEDANYLSGRDASGIHVDPVNGSYDGVKEDLEASHLQSEFNKFDAVKLVQEVVNEILDDTSDTQSITSENSLDQELSENGLREVEKQSISSSKSLNKENINKFEGEGRFSLDEEWGSSPDIVSTQEYKREMSPDKIEPYPRKMKNWSKLKKLMLLKRSIKAMEKARELKSQSQLLLSLPSDPQPEKIDLRQQMIDERKKAEQWMLDYAVQNIVTKLTPARKRRVSMLVEAFEAVVPLPAV